MDQATDLGMDQATDLGMDQATDLVMDQATDLVTDLVTVSVQVLATDQVTAAIGFLTVKAMRRRLVRTTIQALTAADRTAARSCASACIMRTTISLAAWLIAIALAAAANFSTTKARASASCVTNCN